MHFLLFTKQIQVIVGYVFRVFIRRFSKHVYTLRAVVLSAVCVCYQLMKNCSYLITKFCKPFKGRRELILLDMVIFSPAN